MDNVLPWLHGLCECLACGDSWVGVWPLGADDLVCPRCNSKDTVREESEEAMSEGEAK